MKKEKKLSSTKWNDSQTEYKKVNTTNNRLDFADPESDLNLLEDTRQTLISKSRNKGKYTGDTSRGKTRWERKKYSQVAKQVKSFNAIDMNDLFKSDLLQVKIPVTGETDNYTVTIKLNGVIAEIARNIKNNNNKFEFRTVIQALTKIFNTTNIYINCTCLNKDTKIKLLDETIPTVAELKARFDSGERLYVYSVDEKGDFRPGEVEKVWITGSATEFIKITLDNGKEIITTPDHRYMLRNGNYKMANQLEIGQSLMPLYFSKSKNSGETVKLNSTGNYHSTYSRIVKFYDQNGIALKQKKAEEDRSASIRKGYYVQCEKVLRYLIENKLELTEENYLKYKPEQAPKIKTLFKSFDEAVTYFRLNHKVAGIEYITKPAEDVYDIKVKQFENFFVDAGVILHNCPDHLYNYAHWNIINQVSTEDTAHDPGPGKGIKNPNDDKGRGCKHTLLILANGDWLMKVASVITNYVHYAEENLQKPFLKVIFPKLYGIDAETAVENGLIEDDKYLQNSTGLIDQINDWAKNRGKFVKGSNINPVAATKYGKTNKDKESEKQDTDEKK